MSIPRQARFLAALAVMCLFAAFPQTRVAAQSVAQSAAQNEPAKKKQSPNGQIVFQSTQGGDGFVNDIYVMDADGKRQTRLTYTPNFDETIPIWSPKGDQIAFQTNRGGNGYELYLMDADGSNQRPLRSAAHGGPIVGSSFEWSPDGKRLAYASGSDVYVIKVSTPGGDDSKAAPVSVSGGRLSGSEDIEVSWSPSGNRLVVRNAQNCGGCTDLYTVNADGTNRVQVTNGIGFDQHPRWSPSGMFIAYEADRGGRGIYVIKADGTGTETKVSGAVGSFGVVEWAPDGSRLAFKSSAEKVYLVNPDGSGLTLLTDVPADGGGAVFWSPDSAKVAFHNFNSGFVDIYVVNADGSGHKASNYTKTKRDDEFACNWQRLPQENREQEDRR